jgi:hypothetical protein
MAQSQNELFTRKNVLNMIAGMRGLIDGSAQIYSGYSNKPASDSIANQERRNFPNEELIKDVHYRGILSMEAAADHMMVFTDSISEPAKTIAPWTCVRGFLESCALAIWFLDPDINAMTRVGRCFAFRYSGFVEQIKFLKVDKAYEEIDKVQQRMRKVEKDAVSLGYSRLLKNGDINGIAMHMPSITNLIGITLNREGEYRLLSGIAHGHHWAISQLGLHVITKENFDGQEVKVLEKYLHPEVVVFASNIVITSFARVIWYLWRLYGWDLDEIEHFLDQTYEQLNYKAEMHFWHSV